MIIVIFDNDNIMIMMFIDIFKLYFIKKEMFTIDHRFYKYLAIYFLLNKSPGCREIFLGGHRKNLQK